VQENDLTGVLRELGIDFYLIQDEAMASCPSHSPDRKQRTISWSVNIRTGVHYCFSCGFRGNLASLAQRVLKISYPQAVIWVNERAGWARSHKWREDFGNNNYAPPELKISEADLALFTDPPQSALESRRINPEYALKFGVRWREEERSWIFPVRDPYTSVLWGWQEKSDVTRIFRNYPAGVRRSKTLFGAGVAAYGSTAILVESPVDAVRASLTGLGSGLASFGAAVSDTQLSLIRELCGRVIVALDNDPAGIRGTAAIAGRNLGIPVRVFNYGTSGAKDIGDLGDDEIKQGIDNSISAIYYR
jgi:hypothetical protein